jgi:predicted Rossmann-fold nucleotide-binding protein
VAFVRANKASRLRPSRRERYRVTVFGSARTQPGHWVYEEVKQMCSALSAMNCDIITGGGPGLMQAANEGARTAEASQGGCGASEFGFICRSSSA